MLLTLSTTHRPATDLGYLLAKHPDRCQTFDLAFGHAHVFYPEASASRCTAVLLLDLDPVGLVRRRKRDVAPSLAHYVNDRPYVASSFLSVAIARLLGSALHGRCKERPELVETPLPFEATLSSVPCRGGDALLRSLFEPLGYEVTSERAPLDEQFPEWGQSRYFDVTLAGTQRLSDLLAHLYVLLPVLDDDKHYWVGADEVDKLLAKGEGWLSEHPGKDTIARRYLRHQKRLTQEALAQLVCDDDPDPDATEQSEQREEEAIEGTISLNQQRLEAVIAALEERDATSVIDLGCGEGKLLRALMRNKALRRIVGVDVSYRALEAARRRLRLDDLPEKQRERIELFQAGLTYRDSRLGGFDAACAVEVIEHLDPSRLPAFERVVFEIAKPKAVVVTTPNVEYNVLFENLPAGRLRHRDHRFEWTRDELAEWAHRVAAAHGYAVTLSSIGPADPDVGAPTQMAVFQR